MASTTRYLFSRVYMCESGQVCMEAANKGCSSTLSFTQRARASSSLSHHHLTRKRRSVRQTWPGWILTFHAAPSMSSSIFRRTNEREKWREYRLPILSKDYLRNVLRFTPLIHATTWPGYDCDRYIGGKLTLSQCLMHRLILFASIQVDD